MVCYGQGIYLGINTFGDKGQYSQVSFLDETNKVLDFFCSDEMVKTIDSLKLKRFEDVKVAFNLFGKQSVNQSNKISSFVSASLVGISKADSK